MVLVWYWTDSSDDSLDHEADSRITNACRQVSWIGISDIRHRISP